MVRRSVGQKRAAYIHPIGPTLVDNIMQSLSTLLPWPRIETSIPRYVPPR